MKSFRPKGGAGPRGGGGRNAEEDFRGEKRSNATHESTTDPQALQYRKGKGQEAKLCYLGHALMDNRHGLIVDTRTTRHAGYAHSQRVRKRIEEAFGWAKTVGGLRKLKHRGLPKVDFQFTLTFAAYNLVRLRTLGVGT